MKRFFSLFAVVFMAMSMWGATYTKVTSLDGLANGAKYLIIYESSETAGKAMTTTATTTSTKRLTPADVTINNGSIETTATNIVWTLSGSAGAWMFNNGTNYVNGTASGAANCTGTSSNGNKYTITVNEDGSFHLQITNNADRVLEYNTSGPYFAHYKSTQPDVCLYREVVGETFNINIDENIENGTVTANTSSAAEGATVTLTANPAAGYMLSAWDVKDASNNAITVTDNTFTMPAANVTVSATFAVIPEKTIAEFIAAEGGMCYLTGIVSNIVNTTYGNFDLTDESGTIYVYGCLTAEGEAKQFASLGVVAGDKIKVLADEYTVFNETQEAVNVIFVEEIEIEKTKYTVTIETPENGTLVVKEGENVLTSGAEVEEGTTLTIECTPNRGYSLRNWQAIDASTHTYTSASTYDVTANVTIKANFDEITKYTITLADDNTELTPEYGGESIVLPSREAVGDYTFAGWSETNVAEETTTAPTIIPAGEYTPTATKPLYPVYTRSAAGGSTDVPVTLVIADNLPEGTASGDKVKSFTLDEHVTATSTGGESTSSKIYGSPLSQWRFYRSDNGEMTISTTEGTLKSVTVTYSVDKNGVMLHGEDEIASGTAVENINATSIAFTVGGGETGKTNGVIRVTEIAVVYTVEGNTTYYLSSPAAPEPTAKTIDFYAAGTDGYYTTFSNDKVVSFPSMMEVNGEYVYFTVYGVMAEGNTILLDDEVESALVVDDVYYLTENEGYLIKAETTGTVAYTGEAVISVEYTELDDNLSANDANNALRPASAAKENTGYKFYMLAYSDSDHTPASLGFYWGEEGGAAFTSRDNSAYLAVPVVEGKQAPRRFVFSQTDTATDLESVDAATAVKFFENGTLYIQKNGRVYNVEGMIVK